MKTLVLCRHAKSDWPHGVPDQRRPLKDRGWNDASTLGQLLAKQSFMPDLIVSSPAQRALSTAEVIAREVGYSDSLQVEPSIYHEGTGSLVEYVRALPKKHDTVMIFGHNPTMEQAVAFFLQTGSYFEMPTCAMACLESHSATWKQFDTRNLHLRWYLIPRLRRKSR